MKKLKIYLDTSAIGYLDEQSSPKEMIDMQVLWDEIRHEKYDVMLSEVTLAELNASKNVEKVEALSGFLNDIQ